MQITRGGKSGASFVALVVAMVLSGFGMAANAALDAGVTTLLGDAKTDMGTLGLAVFGIAVVIALYKWFKRGL